MNKIKLRYILSILLDYAIYVVLVVCLTKSKIFDNTLLYVILINAILMLFWLEEIPLKGYSVGKYVMGVKIVSTRSNSGIIIKQLFVRRILEVLHVYKIVFWRLRINTDRISESKIVKNNALSRSGKQNKESSKGSMKDISTKLRSLRTKAFFIDLLIIIWVPLIIFLIRIPFLRSYINTWNEYMAYIIDGSLTVLFIVYWIFRDLKFDNGSYGKIRVGICIKSDDGDEPSKVQRLVKNILAFGLFPIEFLMFIMGKKMLSESVSYTHIETIGNPFE